LRKEFATKIQRKNEIKKAVKLFTAFFNGKKAAFYGSFTRGYWGI
jgi:hypothetical protein